MRSLVFKQWKSMAMDNVDHGSTHHIHHSHASSGTGTGGVDVIEDTPIIDPPIQAQRSNYRCCGFGCHCSYYRIPTLHELYQREKRLLRAIVIIVTVLNIPFGNFILYPFQLFSTWIHESFHGLAALSIGGSISWLNIYPDGSGLANTIIPSGVFQSAWVASAGYQGTALLGGIMLMLRRTSSAGVRIGTCGIGLAMLASCILFVRNTFGLSMLILMAILLMIAGWKLPSFWVGELYTLLAVTTCLNAISSIRMLYFVTESSIGGVTRSSDATVMQNITKIHAWIWASAWLVLACWMTAMGVFITIETNEKDSQHAVSGDVGRGEDQDRIALTTTELV